MKRALRILIRIITAPIVICIQVGLIIVGLSFVFSAWLFENADRHYSYLDHLKNDVKDIKNYWKGFFK